MRGKFAKYYTAYDHRATDEQITVMWRDAAFAFDANVLLNLYRYSSETRDQILAKIRDLRGRVWLPHQAAEEYHRNRLSVIADQVRVYSAVATHLRQLIEKMDGKGPIPSALIVERITPAIREAISAVARLQEAHMDELRGDDAVLEQLTDIFDDSKIGEAFTVDCLEDIYKNARERYEKGIPPGYKDADKPEPERYGDVVIWHELIDYAQREKRPLIFVTDDAKEDWWFKVNGFTLGPRRELVEEMRASADVVFYMYTSDQFIRYATPTAEIDETQKAIDEVREVREREAVPRTAGFPPAWITDFSATRALQDQAHDLNQVLFGSSTAYGLAEQIRQIQEATRQSFPSVKLGNDLQQQLEQLRPPAGYSQLEEIRRHLNQLRPWYQP